MQKHHTYELWVSTLCTRCAQRVTGCTVLP